MSIEAIQSIPLLVDGKLVPAAKGDPLINPASGMPIASAPAASAGLLDTAIEAASRSQSAWAQDEAGRRNALKSMETTLKQNVELLANTLSLEIGIPIKAAQLEVAMAAAFLKHRAEAALPVDVIHDDAKQRVRVVRRPVGVVGAILPWNAPLLIACEKIGTAFIAGNTVVLKPSPLAPLTVALFAKLIAPHLPAGVLNVVPGDSDTGAALVAHSRVNMISFTGSIRAGQAIMAASAPGLKRLSLELGGNDAAIILSDIDVQRMAPRIFMSAFYRSGQICAAVKRLYVHESVHDKMLDALSACAKASVLGDPLDTRTTMGPVSNRAQFERVKRLLDDAVSTGGTTTSGAHEIREGSLFMSPTLVSGLPENSRLVQEEQFGPLLPVISFGRVEEAIAAANASEYGLGASVWGSDIDKAAEAATELDAGSVWVNRHGLVLPEIPFGGVKLSGIGRSNGAVGIDNYCELKTVSVALG